MKKHVVVVDKNSIYFSSDSFEKVLEKCQELRKTNPLFWRGEKKGDNYVHLDHEYQGKGNRAIDDNIIVEFPRGKGIRELNKLADEAIVNLRICVNDSYKTLYENENGLTKLQAIEYIRQKREYKSNLIYKFTVVSAED